MARLWRSRRWRRLLNLIDHLPAASFFAEAQAEDDEMARAYLASDRAIESGAPRVSEWDPVRAELTNIYEALTQVIAAVAALGGGHVDVRPRPRPVTAIDRARRRQAREQHEKLVARLVKRG